MDMALQVQGWEPGDCSGCGVSPGVMECSRTHGCTTMDTLNR